MENQDRTPSEETSPPTPAPKPKKRFTLDTVIPTVTARVHLPFLYEDFEPWTFVFRVALTRDMQAKKDAYLALAPSKRKEQFEQQRLDEICDLLSELPSGFGDIGSVLGSTGTKSPGEEFRDYYLQAVKRGPNHRATLDAIIEGAYNIYTSTVTPQEFFPSPADSGA